MLHVPKNPAASAGFTAKTPTPGSLKRSDFLSTNLGLQSLASSGQPAIAILIFQPA